MSNCNCHVELWYNHKTHLIGIEYPHNNPHHYDGVSEFLCRVCGSRYGRWSFRKLKDGEFEHPFGLNPVDYYLHTFAQPKTTKVRPTSIFFNNKMLVMANGKAVWNSVSNAKNGLINHLKSRGVNNAREMVKHWTDTNQIEFRAV